MFIEYHAINFNTESAIRFVEIWWAIVYAIAWGLCH